MPVRTQEVNMTDKAPQYMMKEGYDRARRTLAPKTVITTGGHLTGSEGSFSGSHASAEGAPNPTQQELNTESDKPRPQDRPTEPQPQDRRAEPRPLSTNRG